MSLNQIYVALDQVYVAISGNIASGKSNCMNQIPSDWGFQKILETFDDDVLADFYRDRQTFGRFTQEVFMHNRARALRVITERPGLYVSDFVYGVDSAVYAKNLLHEGGITQVQYDELCQFERVKGEGLPSPDLLVYLSTGVEVLQARIQHRGRPQEAMLLTDEGREYLTRLEGFHQAMFDAYPGKKAIIITDNITLVNEWNGGCPPRTNIDQTIGFIVESLHRQYEGIPFRFEISFGKK